MSHRRERAVPYSRADGSPGALTLSYTDPTGVQAGRPPVVLVHGLWDDMQVWQSGPPELLPPADDSVHAGPPLRLIPRVALTEAPGSDPRALWDALELAGFAGLSWNQIDTGGPLPGGTDRELAAVVDFALETYQAEKVCLVGHSRGGLVARAYLIGPDAAAKVAALVTLGTPHWGTRLSALPGQIEADLASAILGNFGLPGKLLGMLATPFVVRLVNDLAAGFTADFDLLAWKAPVNPRLAAIMVASRYPPIRYVAIAGTDPHSHDLRLYQYTAGSFVPAGFPPRFHWQEASYPPAGEPPVPLPRRLGELGAELGVGTLTGMPELYPEHPGRPECGDGAVAKHSAWFGDPEPDPAQGYVRNLKFPVGHLALPHRPEVQAAIVAELEAAAGDR